MTKPRTYWHLEEQKRIASRYEIATSRLHYYLAKGGFEVAVPASQWYCRYQQNCPIECTDWESFVDPRQTTYSKYVAIQEKQEAFCDGLFQLVEDRHYDQNLSADYASAWEQVIAPLRYPLHGLQMVAAYVGQMAPSGRISVACLFQSADEVRRIQRIAYRLGQLQMVYPDFGVDGRNLWEKAGHWQPLRLAVERLLITYDWFEAFVALNLVLKPILDELFMVHFGRVAACHGDYILDELFSSLNDDCLWHRQWSGALALIVTESPANKQIIEGWISKWHELVMEGVIAFSPFFEQGVGAKSFSTVLPELAISYSAYIEPLRLELREGKPATSTTNS